MTNKKLHILVEAAIMIALGTVLSLIKIPYVFGGGVTPLSMLPVCLFGIRRGVKWGFGASFVYAVLQMLLSLAKVIGWGLTPIVLLACIFLDYLLAYTVLGLAGFGHKKGRFGMCAAVFAAMVARFLCHFISGTVLFGTFGLDDVWYSITYNGSYMLPEAILTIAALLILSAIPKTWALLTKTE